MENEELNTEEGSAPSETEEEPTRSFRVRRAGNVGAAATLDSFAPTVWKRRKKGMMAIHLDRLAP
jgi:hypothetical protein